MPSPPYDREEDKSQLLRHILHRWPHFKVCVFTSAFPTSTGPAHSFRSSSLNSVQSCARHWYSWSKVVSNPQPARTYRLQRDRRWVHTRFIREHLGGQCPQHTMYTLVMSSQDPNQRDATGARSISKCFGRHPNLLSRWDRGTTRARQTCGVYSPILQAPVCVDLVLVADSITSVFTSSILPLIFQLKFAPSE